MNLRDLEYVVAIADLGSMARAAEQCNVSQSTMSIQLKKLEEYLGVALFERVHKRLVLTPTGSGLLEIARGITQDAKRLRTLAKQAQDPFAGPFRLGVFPTIAPYLLPRIIPALSQAFPKLTLLLIEEKSPDLLEGLRSGRLDAALLALPVHDATLHAEPLFHDPFLLACHPSHPLAARTHVTMADLRGETLLLLEDGHCLRDQALDVCALSGAFERTDFRATSMETLRHMVAANVGITLIPQIACTEGENVRYIPFTGKTIPSRRIGLLWRPSSPREKVMGEMGELIAMSH